VCIGILGNKIGMTQIFDQKGNIIPISIIRVGPCFVTQIKTLKKNGYDAIQIGYLTLKKNSKKIKKPGLGHFKKSNVSPLRHLKEYQTLNNKEFQLGQLLKVDMFKIGSKVDISGFTIGKGFAGNQKRNKFKRGPMTHGSKNHREPGSIGSSTGVSRVFPGKKMAGHLGNVKRTIKNLEIFDIILEENLLIVKGSIPGKRKNLVSIKYSKSEL
jgi:large subunit ribosomal protein L3